MKVKVNKRRIKKNLVFKNIKSEIKTKELSIMPISFIESLVHNIKIDSYQLKSFLRKLSILNNKSKILLQISTINSLIKKIIVNITILKNQKKSLDNSIADGTFFNWKEFIEIIIRKASKKNYITKKDRQTLEEFAHILQSPAYCNPYDYDAYLRWIIYSVDEKIGITSHISKELKLQKNKLEAQEKKVIEKQELIKQAMKEIKLKDLIQFIKSVKLLIRKIRIITKNNKLSVKELDRMNDLINNVLFNSKI